jgi:hypothetical protein
MAEYYPLLAKAVASLPNSTTESRRVIYERARKALLGQLRNLQPPVAEDDIARESNALDAAVARLETEFTATPPVVQPEAAPDPAVPDSAPPIDLAPPPPSPVVEKPASPFLPPRPRVPRPPPAVPPRPPLRPWTPGGKTVSDAPAGTEVPPAPADTPPPVTPEIGAPDAGASTPDLAQAPSLDVVAPTSDAPSLLTEAPSAVLAPLPVLPEGRPLILPVQGAVSADAALDGDVPATVAVADPQVSRLRSDVQRPFAPQPPRPAPPQQRRTWIVAAVVAMIVVVVALAAYKLRDRPEDLARLRPAAAANTDGSVGSSGKLADRVGGSVVSAPSASSQQIAAPAPATSVAQAPTAADPSPAQPAPQQAPLSVAHRAALLVQAPDEENKVKTYIGTVLWKLDNVSNGPGQPLSTAVRADVDVPDAKLQVSFVFQKNMDATLPASHTIKIQFTVGADSPIGGVQQINVPQMRKEDAQAGEPLSGIPVPITTNSFLIGLSRGASEETNIDLLRTRAWLDLPMLMASGRVAKMTIEKSTSGQRAFDDALVSWQQPGQ